MPKYVRIDVNGIEYIISLEEIMYIRKDDYTITIEYKDNHSVELVFNDEHGENSAIEYLDTDPYVESFDGSDIARVLKDRCDRQFSSFFTMLITNNNSN